MANQVKHIAPEGRPIYILMEEHSHLTDFSQKLVELTKGLQNYDQLSEASESLEEIERMLGYFKEAQRHYLREENVLFPYLEKKGIKGPPSQMWDEHEQIRDLEKKIFKLFENREKEQFRTFAKDIFQHSEELSKLLVMHYYKENNILFPMAMNTFEDFYWERTEQQFNEIGYCSFSPVEDKETVDKSKMETKITGGMIDTGTGSLSIEQLVNMLKTLPVEITFVDDRDIFQYYNPVAEQIFVRTNAAIGLEVQKCHPKKSVHLVNQIIDDFRNGRKDMVDFWIEMKDKYVYIRYFAVRNSEGKYLGCMEATQDIKDLQKITGEKRLM